MAWLKKYNGHLGKAMTDVALLWPGLHRPEYEAAIEQVLSFLFLHHGDFRVKDHREFVARHLTEQLQLPPGRLGA